MKKPTVKLSQSMPLDNQSGKVFIESIQKAATDYAAACRKAGVEPDDIFSIFRERARIAYRNHSIF